MSLTRRLLASYLAIVVVTGAVLTAAADVLLRRRLVDEAITGLEREARYFATLAEARRGPPLDSLLRALGAATGRRLTAIDRSGTVLADTEFPGDQLAALENHAARPEFREALAGRRGTDLRRSASTGREELKVAVPFAGGAVRVSAPIPQVDALVHRAQGAVLAGALIALIAAGLLAYGFSVNVARPLVRLRDAAQAIARGEHPPVDLRGRDEVGDLARALRAVDESLSGRLADLERARSETAALIAAMVEGVVACDARGAVTSLNPAARTLLGLADGDPPPNARELFHQRMARDAVDAVLGGETITALEIDVSGRMILLSGRPLAGGGAVFVAHEVTTLKRLETIRRDFVANVSHELKTPLTVVRGYAETLLKDDPPTDVRAGFLSAMLANAQRMQRLIDDLLDLSRIESGGWRPVPGPVALEPLAREVWSTVEASVHKSLRFDVALEPGAGDAWADAEAVRQILQNVLENAARHTGDGGRIAIRAARVSAGIRLEISDTGAGIPGEHLPRIFERFYRADPARSREQGGTGLGLAIVKHLVEAHGGRVEAESTLGAGTTIRLVLPAP